MSPDLPSSDTAVAVSIVVPVRNEAENVAPLIAEIAAALDGRWIHEIIYVNDGSTDATAAFTREMMHAALELNGPTFAHAILTTAQLIAAFPTPEQTGSGADADQRSNLTSGVAR